MKQAVILYNSKSGTTKNYAHEIGDYIASRDVGAEVYTIEDCPGTILENADYILFGSWTNGLFVIMQGPDLVWKDFAANLPSLPAAKVGLFTTYKFLTGSMFKNLGKTLQGKFADPVVELSSRTGQLSSDDKMALDRFVAVNFDA